MWDFPLALVVIQPKTYFSKHENTRTSKGNLTLLNYLDCRLHKQKITVICLHLRRQARAFTVQASRQNLVTTCSGILFHSMSSIKQVISKPLASTAFFDKFCFNYFHYIARAHTNSERFHLDVRDWFSRVQKDWDWESVGGGGAYNTHCSKLIQ